MRFVTAPAFLVAFWTRAPAGAAELLYYSVDTVMTNDSALLYSIWQDTLD